MFLSMENSESVSISSVFGCDFLFCENILFSLLRCFLLFLLVLFKAFYPIPPKERTVVHKGDIMVCRY